MSSEDTARAGAQAVIPDDEILDIAVVMPRGSTLAGVFGAAAGVGTGSSNSTMAWGIAGGMLAQRANSAAKGSYPSIVLALSPTRLYILGRSRTGVVGGWKHLHPVAHIERQNLEIKRHKHGTVRVIELTDTTTGNALEFEVMTIGGHGLGELLDALGN
jgi:hypothetical protein